MATVEEIRKDIEKKKKEKISAQQKRLRELEMQLTEEENLEIVRMIKAVRMDNKELTAFPNAYVSGLITLPDEMMEAETVPNPDDKDAGGWADGGKACGLYLYREMPSRYRLSGLRGEYERVRRKSAGGGAGAGKRVRQQ